LAGEIMPLLFSSKGMLTYSPSIVAALVKVLGGSATSDMEVTFAPAASAPHVPVISARVMPAVTATNTNPRAIKIERRVLRRSRTPHGKNWLTKNRHPAAEAKA
jgi:hypothetical protein